MLHLLEPSNYLIEYIEIAKGFVGVYATIAIFVELCPLIPGTLSALRQIVFLTCCQVRLGLFERMSAARPAT